METDTSAETLFTQDKQGTKPHHTDSMKNMRKHRREEHLWKIDKLKEAEV